MLSRFALQGARSFTSTVSRNARFESSRVSRGFGIKTGPTLKERLLGPTTGKPFVYGTYALAGASAFGIGALMYYGLKRDQSSILQQSALWPQYVRDRLHSTYAYLLGSLSLTAASGMAASRSAMIMRLSQAGGLMNFALTMAAIIGSSYLCRAIDYDNTLVKHAAWMLHCGVMGAVLAPMCFLGGPVLIRAAWYTAGIAAGLSATAITAPSEKFLMMSGPLAMGLGVVLVANIGTFFLPPGSALGAGLTSIVVYGGLILFSAFLLYNTQRVVKNAERHPPSNAYYQQAVRSYDPINAQMAIYADILNIFVRLAMIMGGGNNKKR